jgi:hypothetical protein
MTKPERHDLIKLLKARARLANRVVERRAAELLADIELHLATRYRVESAA